MDSWTLDKIYIPDMYIVLDKKYFVQADGRGISGKIWKCFMEMQILRTILWYFLAGVLKVGFYVMRFFRNCDRNELYILQEVSECSHESNWLQQHLSFLCHQSELSLYVFIDVLCKFAC